MHKLDTGQIQNHLGLLSDNALKTIDTHRFKELASVGSISKASLARLLGISRPKLYTRSARITKKDIENRIIPFVYISDLAYILFKEDKNKTMEWLMAPNHIFFNSSPFQMSMAGRAETVINKLREWSGIEDASSK